MTRLNSHDWGLRTFRWPGHGWPGRGLGLGGLLDSPALRASAELPPAARALPARYVVVTVRNPRASTLSRAASTPGGYDAMGPYAAGSGARRTAGALAADYHLEETSSWPIALLGVHCLVYALPAGVAPELLLERLARDAAGGVRATAAVVRDADDTLQRSLLHAATQSGADGRGRCAALSRGDNVRVAIIDSGVAVDHPDFPRHLTTRNFVDNDVRAFSEDAHGTAVPA